MNEREKGIIEFEDLIVNRLKTLLKLKSEGNEVRR